MSNVRFATLEDVARIAEILESVDKLHADNLPDIFHGKNPYYPETRIKEILEDEDDGTCFIVSINEQDEITGVLVCWVDEWQDHDLFADCKKLWIETNCVAEQHRVKGYGKMLLDYAKAFAKEQECSRIVLNTYVFNKNAFEFYKSQGMEISSYSMEYKL